MIKRTSMGKENNGKIRKEKWKKEKEALKTSSVRLQAKVRQSLHNSNKHTRTHDWTCCQGDKRQHSPALPRRVSHSDVIGCRQYRAGPWPIGQRHRRAQPVLVCFFFPFFHSFYPLNLFLSSGALSLSRLPSHFSNPLSFWLIQLGQRAATEVEALGLSLLMKRVAD